MNKIIYFYPHTNESDAPLLTYAVPATGIESLDINLVAMFIVEKRSAKYRVEVKLDGNIFLKKENNLVPISQDDKFGDFGQGLEIGAFASIKVGFDLIKITMNETALFEITLFDEVGNPLASAETTLYFIGE